MLRGITDKGQTSACKADAKTLETAIESYFAQVGGTTIPGATASDRAATLVSAGFLRSASTSFDVAANGAISATSGGNCVGVSLA